MNLSIIINKTLIIIFIITLLTPSVLSLTIHPGAHFYGGRLDVTFQSSTTFSYLAVGDDFVVFDALNLSVSSITSVMEINISNINSEKNLTQGTTVLQFNATYAGPTATFTFIGNHTNARYNVYVDDVARSHSDSANQVVFTLNTWSEHDIEIELDGYIPDPPYNGSSVYHNLTNYDNMTWDRGNYSDREVLVGKAGSYPTSPTDGTVWQNSTLQFYNFSVNETQYFTAWSYNDTTGLYSSTGLNLEWGALRMQCYNETALPDSVGINYDIQISNSDLSIVYSGTDLSNPTYLDVNDIPYGDSTLFSISNESGYADKQYTYDIVLNTFYNLTFWLPVEEPSGGGDPDPDDPTEYSENYVITVVGPQGEYGQDPPIEDATVEVKRYINETETYQDVGIYETDANGQFQIALIPGKTYYFEITKDGYETELAYWVPPEIEFTDDRYHTFRISPSNIPIFPEYDYFWDDVLFTGTMEKHKGLDYTGNITITFEDSNGSTTDTQVKLMEMDGETLTVIGWYNDTSNSWEYTFYGINITHVHTATLWINNSANYDVGIPVTITIINLEIYIPGAEKSNLQDRFESIFGDIPFEVFAAIAAGFGLIALCSFGPYNTGLGIMMCGIIMGIIQAIGTVRLDDILPEALTLIIPVVIVIAGIYVYTKDPGGHS